MASVNLSQFHLVFDDEFNNLSLKSSNNPNGTWGTSYFFGRTISTNGEQEYYVDPNATPSLNPFSINNGVLNIAANPTPSSMRSQVQNLPYTSGMISSDGSFAQTYGYFEMRAQLPAGQGLWPAFWLLPTDHSWPPEIDVVEMLGNQPTTDYTTVHSSTGGTHGTGTTVANTTTGFHTYGVDWEPNNVTFYFDGQQVYQTATPSDMHKPMYMIANLAVGGGWPGSPNSSTHFPANMQIDYIKAYSSANTVASVNHTTLPAQTSSTTPTPTPTNTTTTPAPTNSTGALSNLGDHSGTGSTSTTTSTGTSSTSTDTGTHTTGTGTTGTTATTGTTGITGTTGTTGTTATTGTTTGTASSGTATATDGTHLIDLSKVTHGTSLDLNALMKAVGSAGSHDATLHLTEVGPFLHVSVDAGGGYHGEVNVLDGQFAKLMTLADLAHMCQHHA